VAWSKTDRAKMRRLLIMGCCTLSTRGCFSFKSFRGWGDSDCGRYPENQRHTSGSGGSQWRGDLKALHPKGAQESVGVFYPVSSRDTSPGSMRAPTHLYNATVVIYLSGNGSRSMQKVTR